MEKIKYLFVPSGSDENCWVRIIDVCYFVSNEVNIIVIGLKTGQELRLNSNQNGNYISFDKLIESLPDNFVKSARDSIVNLDLVQDLKPWISHCLVAEFHKRNLIFSRRESIKLRMKYRLKNQLPFITIPEKE